MISAVSTLTVDISMDLKKIVHAVSSLLGFKCPICSKSVASDEMEMHFIMCLSKPRLSYNGKGYLSCLLPDVKMSWTAGGIASR